MHCRKTLLTAVLISSLMMTSVAEADGARARTGFDRWGKSQAVTRPEASANASSIVQDGSGNAAGLAQTGSGNVAGIHQYGRGNTGVIVQAGSNNTACLIQAGRNISGAVQQVGDNQSSGLLQTRWGSRNIPVEACEKTHSRHDIIAYAIRGPQAFPRARARRR